MSRIQAALIAILVLLSGMPVTAARATYAPDEAPPRKDPALNAPATTYSWRGHLVDGQRVRHAVWL